ncbi:MAG: hypothetical protein EXQ85_04845 [Alphaproteobacteria bacterium]|nr:hypothetical protein [Alphaproteobacteria bacterium]
MRDNGQGSETDENEADDPKVQRLHIIGRFSRHVATLPWCTRLGEPLDKQERIDAEAYVSAVGFPQASIATIIDWREAEHIAESPRWDDTWWEAEQQLQAGLVTQALADLKEAELMDALNHVATQAAGGAVSAVEAAARRAGYREETAGEEGSFLTALSGLAVSASYQAGLVLAALGDENHPFAIKFRLIESGRLPIGVIGSTFSIF